MGRQQLDQFQRIDSPCNTYRYGPISSHCKVCVIFVGESVMLRTSAKCCMRALLGHLMSPYGCTTSSSNYGWARFNTMRPRQNDFWQTIFANAFLNGNYCSVIEISLKFVQIPIGNRSALLQIMAWYRTGNMPLSKPMMAFVTDAYTRHSASRS